MGGYITSTGNKRLLVNASGRMEKFLNSLCRKALEMGASEVVSIAADEIIIDKRARLKCIAPLCVNYGHNLMCPPNTIPIAQFEEILRGYRCALLIKVNVSNGGLPQEITGSCNLAKIWESIKLAGRTEQERKQSPQAEYCSSLWKGQKQVNYIISRIESVCLQEGYYFAAGLSPGACMLCDECVGASSQLPCRHPFEARPSLDSMGIDVLKTCNQAGMEVSFSIHDGRSFIGVVLID